MRYALHAGEIPVPARLEKAIAHKVDKVETRLKRYHPDAAELEIRLGYREKTKEYECAVVLKAFRDTLHARKEAPELRAAVDKTFEALLREIETYRVRINKSLQPHQQ
jgi:ribosome-associated translation inhibitor RaiA